MTQHEHEQSKRAVEEATAALEAAKEQRKIVDIITSALKFQREQNHFGEMIRRSIEGKPS